MQINHCNTKVYFWNAFILGLFLFFCFPALAVSYAQDNPDENQAGAGSALEPIIINGDTVEYSTDSKDVTISGSAEVIYKGTRLTCKKLTFNSQSKEGTAEGDARLEEKDGVIEGTKIIYNFESKRGTIIDADFRSNPYFGRARKVDKVSEDEFIAFRGYMTTCSYNNPHWRMKSKKIDMFPADKVITKNDTVYFGKAPALYLPQFTHSLKEPVMHVQIMPGKTKDWGPYLLSAWRYKLTDNITGRIYFDERSNLGVAEGLGINYKLVDYGKGDFKYYYTQERDKTKRLGTKDDNIPKIFERYMIRNRHKWDIDNSTNLTSEYYKIVDSRRALFPSGNYSFLKEYFFREYEKDAQPLSYALFHHSFHNSTIDMLIQKRTNRWYSQEEKLPEISYSSPSVQIGDSRFFFSNSSSYLNYNYKNAVPSDSFNDTEYNKFYTANTLSLPLKVSFFNLTPSISAQDTYIDKSTLGATHQLVFATGADLSTKFYRIFNLKTNSLGLDINGLRHIITPTIGYSANKTSTMPGDKFRYGGSATTGSSSASLGLTNKLQTKRKGQSVELVNFDITDTYTISPKSGDKRGSSLADLLFKLQVLPYSWLSLNSDLTYAHTGKYSNPNYNHFSNASYDVNFNFGTDRTIGFGQRYIRKGTNYLTLDLKWRLNPKWQFGYYQSRNKGHDPAYRRGIREQQYSFIRNLHCWDMELTYNKKTGGMIAGEGIWLIFRLKAFPELEFGYDQSYHAPKTGSQSEAGR